MQLLQGHVIYVQKSTFLHAASCRHKDVVKLLRKTGAHFSRDQLEEAGTELCRSGRKIRNVK